MSISFYLIQALGIVAFLIFALAFYLKDRKKILAVQIFALVLWSAHMALLNAWTGAALLMLGAVRSFVFYFKGKNTLLGKDIVLYLFIVSIAVFTAITWAGYLSLLPMVAVILVTFSHWQNEPQKLRLIFMFSGIFWFSYDLLVHSYSGMIAEVVMFLMVIGSYVKEKNSVNKV